MQDIDRHENGRECSASQKDIGFSAKLPENTDIHCVRVMELNGSSSAMTLESYCKIFSLLLLTSKGFACIDYFFGFFFSRLSYGVSHRWIGILKILLVCEHSIAWDV